MTICRWFLNLLLGFSRIQSDITSCYSSTVPAAHSPTLYSLSNYYELSYDNDYISSDEIELENNVWDFQDPKSIRDDILFNHHGESAFDDH